MCICRDNVMRCRGGDSPARRCIGAINRLSLKWHWPQNCHCEGALRPWQSREGSYVFAGSILLFNRVLRDSHVASLLGMTNLGTSRHKIHTSNIASLQGAHYPQGARRIRKAAKPPTAAQGTPLQSNLAARAVGDGLYGLQLPPRDCHVASLLAMTHQVVRRCTSALLPLNGSVQGGH